MGAQPCQLRPVLTLYARDGASEVALVRWPTTIGTWQREKRAVGAVVNRYKNSRAGSFFWHEIVAAPVWFAPASGLVLILHRNTWGGDTGVRTHGTVSYLSIAGGSASHGCHRLFTYQALRLAGFLLAHRPFTVRGEVRETYQRRVRWQPIRRSY